MKKLVKWLKNEESGQGMVEYGLIIVVVALVVVLGLGVLGNGLSDFFNDTENKVSNYSPT
ncbi:MAG: Flp family type IVb pilin [Sedimentibacter saalensis]|uniref:Flp family type IVb pilin n=1 Tax=Sedimentibacter saalensis TaxID=130788 RepID=UPI003158B718